ncbi:hypothetical protein J0688_24880, partial [Vibrio parahaemolyticus]|nr:hypothetical protein [Vibrio parahaemolyticus]
RYSQDIISKQHSSQALHFCLAQETRWILLRWLLFWDLQGCKNQHRHFSENMWLAINIFGRYEK